MKVQLGKSPTSALRNCPRREQADGIIADVVGHGDPFGVDGFVGDRHSEAGHYGAGLVSDGSASRAVSACAQAVTANARMARMRTEVSLNMAGSLQTG